MQLGEKVAFFGCVPSSVKISYTAVWKGKICGSRDELMCCKAEKETDKVIILACRTTSQFFFNSQFQR